MAAKERIFANKREGNAARREHSRNAVRVTSGQRSPSSSVDVWIARDNKDGVTVAKEIECGKY